MQFGDEKGKIFVGGLSWDTTHASMLKYFSRYGEVIDCVVMKNPSTGKSRGFGFVTFKDPSCVETVLANGPHVLDGRQIDPKACNPRSMNKAQGGKSAENLKRKVFIGGLPANCNEAMLKEYFAKYGNVTDVVIMYDQQKQRSRGFGFLTFESEDSVENVCQEHFVHINGKQVEVKKAEPRDMKAADGTTLDFCAGMPAGALTYLPGQLGAGGLQVSHMGLSAAAAAAAAAGTIPGIYPGMAAQGWSQHTPGLRLMQPSSPLVTLLVPGSSNYPSLPGTVSGAVSYGAGWPPSAGTPTGDPSPSMTPTPTNASPFGAPVQAHTVFNPMNGSRTPYGALAGQAAGMLGGFAQDPNGYGAGRAYMETNGAVASRNAHMTFQPSVTYTLAQGMQPMSGGGYSLAAPGGTFAGASLIAGTYGQGDAPPAGYVTAQTSPVIGRIPTNHMAAAGFHPYRR